MHLLKSTKEKIKFNLIFNSKIYVITSGGLSNPNYCILIYSILSIICDRLSCLHIIHTNSRVIKILKKKHFHLKLMLAWIKILIFSSDSIVKCIMFIIECSIWNISSMFKSKIVYIIKYVEKDYTLDEQYFFKYSNTIL